MKTNGIESSPLGFADDDAQAKALRLRLYVLCSECASLIDLAEGNRPQRDVEARDIILHEAESTNPGWK